MGPARGQPTCKLISIDLSKLQEELLEEYAYLNEFILEYKSVSGAIVDLEQSLSNIEAIERNFDPDRQNDSTICTALSVHAVIAYYRAFDSTHDRRKQLAKRIPFDNNQREKHVDMMKLRNSAVAHPDEKPKGFYAPFWREQLPVLRVVNDRARLSLMVFQTELVSDVILDLIELIDVSLKFLRPELDSISSSIISAFQSGMNDDKFLSFIVKSLFNPAEYFNGDMEKVNQFWFDENPDFGKLAKHTPYSDKTPEAYKANRDYFDKQSQKTED